MHQLIQFFEVILWVLLRDIITLIIKRLLTKSSTYMGDHLFDACNTTHLNGITCINLITKLYLVPLFLFWHILYSISFRDENYEFRIRIYLYPDEKFGLVKV